MKCIKLGFGTEPGWNGIEVEKLVALGLGTTILASLIRVAG
jgi:hypothetical protein